MLLVVFQKTNYSMVIFEFYFVLVLSHPTPLLKSSSNSKEKSIELQDNFDLSIQNIVPDIPNQNIGW